ncbi:MAG: hypothetical protein IKG47_04270 [Oscillospiraceae bacterium]|nr:hypothetical protein [Oscillospiraceae bacterium]
MKTDLGKLLKAAKPLADTALKKSGDLIVKVTPYVQKGMEAAAPYVQKGVDAVKAVDWKQVLPTAAITAVTVKLKKDKDIADINEQHEETMQKVKDVMADLHEQHVQDQQDIQDLKQAATIDDEEEKV